MSGPRQTPSVLLTQITVRRINRPRIALRVESRPPPRLHPKADDEDTCPS
jgi:hypothetical protein